MNLKYYSGIFVSHSGLEKSRFPLAARRPSFISPPSPLGRPESLRSGSQGMQAMKNIGILLMVFGFLALVYEAFV